MASIQYNLVEFKNEQPKVQLIIPSSEISRIGSPIENYVELPHLKSSQLSFIETRSELKQFQYSTASVKNSGLERVKGDLLCELDEMRDQLRDINRKLENNLKILREQEDDELKQVFSKSIISNYRNNLTKEEVSCSCTKQCQIF